MNVNYDAISAWAAVFVAAVAVISIAVEARRAAFSRGVDVLLRYSAEFAGPEFVHRRRELARMLKRKLSAGSRRRNRTICWQRPPISSITTRRSATCCAANP